MATTTRDDRTPTRDERAFDQAPKAMSSVTWVAIVFTILIIIFGALALGGFFTTGQNDGNNGSGGIGATDSGTTARP